MMESKFSQIAIDYKKNIAGRFALVEGTDLKLRLGGEMFWVTRKIDGHLQIAFFNDGELILLNSNGVERASGLKCMGLMADSLKKAGIKQAIIAAELYMPNADGRPRHGDVVTALADDSLKDKLCLAPFDIIEIDNYPWTAENYGDTLNRLVEIFRDDMVRPVKMRAAHGVDEVKAIYDEWVVEEGAEGLVVHTDSNIVWKIKPRHTIDAAVVGYTETERGVRSLMFAVMRPDGTFQPFAQGSGGMTNEQRADVAKRLSNSHVVSQYILTDSRGIAYQMVRPELVFEISVLDLVARGNDDKVRVNPVLRFDAEQGWLMEGTTPGVTALNVTVQCERTDKRPTETDIRVSQLSDITPFEEPDNTGAPAEASTVLERRVFKKVSGAKVMLHKFLLWKTNKEQTGRYPTYIVYHTDYSSGREEMIKRDMAYTSDEQQARDILASEIAANIKKGWEEVK